MSGLIFAALVFLIVVWAIILGKRQTGSYKTPIQALCVVIVILAVAGCIAFFVAPLILGAFL